MLLLRVVAAEGWEAAAGGAISVAGFACACQPQMPAATIIVTTAPAPKVLARRFKVRIGLDCNGYSTRFVHPKSLMPRQFLLDAPAQKLEGPIGDADGEGNGRGRHGQFRGAFPKDADHIR